MNKLHWIYNRVRVMSVSEILFRLYRHISLAVEKIFFKLDIKPKFTGQVKHAQGLFQDLVAWQNEWRRHFQVDDGYFKQLDSGKIQLFGYKELAIGTEINWHYEPLENITAPQNFGKAINYRNAAIVGNIKVIWELGRHQFLVPIAVYYAVTGDIKYKEFVLRHLQSWLEQNPYACGVHWCSSLELALRLISWSIIHSLFVLRDNNDGLLSAVNDPRQLSDSIYQHIYFIRHYLSRHSSANNHLIGELTGIWVACNIFDLGKQGQRWATYAQRQLEREALRQNHIDGVNKEQAIGYHQEIMEYFMLIMAVAKRCERVLAKSFYDRFDDMSTFLADITPYKGSPPQFGDSDEGFVTFFAADEKAAPFEQIFSAMQVVGTNTRYLGLELPYSNKAFWFAMAYGCITKSIQIRNSPVTLKPYPLAYMQGGYAMLGDEHTHLVFKASELGYLSIAAHGHADALSFCLAINGEWWFVDPGTYAYHGQREWRDYFRGTRAHNTIAVDNENQSAIGGPFLWTRHARANINDWGTNSQGVQSVSGEHDGYKHNNVRHKRKISFHPFARQVEIIDEISATGKHTYQMAFHFSPEVEIEKIADKEFVLSKKDAECSINLMAANQWDWQIYKGSCEPIAGWYSAKLGHKVPAVTLSGELICTGDMSSRTVIKINR